MPNLTQSQKIELVRDNLADLAGSYNLANRGDVVAWWNEYVTEHDMDSYIYTSLDELAEIMGDDSVSFARRIFFGDVDNWGDEYFTLNGYANIVSFNLLDDHHSPIDLSSLAEWMVENDHEQAEEWIAEVEDEEE